LSEQTRQAVDDYLRVANKRPGEGIEVDYALANGCLKYLGRADLLCPIAGIDAAGLKANPG
jgi:hypothetical protein